MASNNEELNDYEGELTTLIAEITTSLAKVRKLGGNNRDEKMAHIKDRLSRVKQVIKSYKLEIRYLPRHEQKPYTKKAKEFQDRIKAMKEEFTEIKTGGAVAGSQDLMDGRSKSVDNPKDMRTEQLLATASATQDDSLASLARTTETATKTVELGANIAREMQSQTEQLRKIDEDMDTIDSELQRANKQMKAFVRRMATDKIIMGFMLLVFLGLVGLIIYSIVDGGDENKGDEWQD